MSFNDSAWEYWKNILPPPLRLIDSFSKKLVIEDGSMYINTPIATIKSYLFSRLTLRKFPCIVLRLGMFFLASLKKDSFKSIPVNDSCSEKFLRYAPVPQPISSTDFES